VDERSNERGIMLKGKLTHRRSVGKKYGHSGIAWLRKNIDPKAEVIKGKTKIKYVFPMNKWERRKLKKLAKPYPKKKQNINFIADNDKINITDGGLKISSTN
jgi:hypothetical protein